MSTISDFEAVYGPNIFEDMITRRDPIAHSKWVELISADIDDIARELKNLRNVIHDDRSSEDSITIQVVGRLKRLGYLAEHSANVAGNADVVIECKNGTFQWLGEAKIYNSSGNIMEGFLQLATRYSAAELNRDHGGLLIYMRDHGEVSHYMALWQKHLLKKAAQKRISGLSTNKCPIDQLSFLSVHDHCITGLRYTIRHKPFILHHDPQDKSGRGRK